VTSNITANSLTLSWTASTSSDVSSYDIYNGETLLGNTASITYNVSGLTTNTSYTFSVRAKDSIGNTASGTTVNATTSSVIDTTAPNNVTNLTASNMTQTGLTLNWTVSTSSDVASYDVYNGNTLLGNTSSTTYDISSLTAGTQYTFNVKAKDVSGNVATGTSVTITTTASNPSVAYVTQNLVAGYDMAQGTGTTCNDLSGNNNTLTLVGTDGTTGGFIGGVLRLDGQNDAGEIIDSNSFAFGSNDFTIQMKFRLNVAQTTQILFSQSGADSGADANTSVTCYMSGDTITFRTVVNSTRYQFATTATLTDTASYHNIAMVRSGNTLYGYLDQVQVGSIALASGGTVNNSTKKFAIGRWGEDPSLYLNGLVRAFLVYNGKALTIAEMSQNDIAFAV
jgi:chitodextrinase